MRVLIAVMVAVHFLSAGLALAETTGERCARLQEKLSAAEQYVQASDASEKAGAEAVRQCVVRARTSCIYITRTTTQHPCARLTSDAEFAAWNQCGSADANRSTAGRAAIQKLRPELAECERTLEAENEVRQKQAAEDAAAVREESQKAAAHEQDIEDRRASGAWIGPALSGAVCAYQAARKSCFAAIATERRYSRYGGTVSLSKLHGFQDTIKAADKGIREVMAILRSRRLKPAPCGGRVALIAQCLMDSGSDACKQGKTAEYVALLPEVDYDSCDDD